MTHEVSFKRQLESFLNKVGKGRCYSLNEIDEIKLILEKYADERYNEGREAGILDAYDRVFWGSDSEN